MPDPQYQQLPAALDLAFVKADEVGFMLTFSNLDLTGYTFDSRIYAKTSVAGVNGGVGASAATVAGETAAAFVVTPVNLTAGVVNISMAETVTNLLQSGGNYRWWFRAVSPGLVTRTYLAGKVTVATP